jgi:hypothetical protein
MQLVRTGHVARYGTTDEDVSNGLVGLRLDGLVTGIRNNVMFNGAPRPDGEW